MSAYKKGETMLKDLLNNFLKYHGKYNPELKNEFKSTIIKQLKP